MPGIAPRIPATSPRLQKRCPSIPLRRASHSSLATRVGPNPSWRSISPLEAGVHADATKGAVPLLTPESATVRLINSEPRPVTRRFGWAPNRKLHSRKALTTNFPDTCSRGPPGNTLETFVGASVTRNAQIFSGSPRRCQFRRAHGDHVAGFVRHQSSGPGFGRHFFAFCAYSTLSQYFLDHAPGLVCVLIRTGKHSLFHLFFPRTPQLFVHLFDVFTWQFVCARP